MTVEAHTYRYHSISWCWSLWKTECTCHLTLERALTSREQPKRDWDMRFPLRKKKSDLHNEANIFSSLGSGMNGCDSGDQKGKIFFFLPGVSEVPEELCFSGDWTLSCSTVDMALWECSTTSWGSCSFEHHCRCVKFASVSRWTECDIKCAATAAWRWVWQMKQGK